MLSLPLLFFGLGTVIAILATQAANLVAPNPATLVEAAAAKQADAIVTLVLLGQDPGKPVVLKRSVYQWKRGGTTSPLLVAIAGGKLKPVSYTHLTLPTKRIV